ncbi:MAG: glycoside-pentoside-hexuronide (GPH):cation symporter [Eubacteriales bacterium]|nr:glycoside-pentoside-hexuronide (GPH):cation symporter [Eubacteriales bacterium]
MTKTKLRAGEQFSFGIYSFGTILSYYLIMSYLQLYMTNIGIPAAAVAIIFVVAKVWDAVNDPIFGVMVDKVNFKKGKYLPWLRIATIAIPLSTVFLFVVPANASLQVKVLWSSAAYILWDMCYTLCDVPFNALATAMTEEQPERNKLYSLAAFFTYLGGLLIAIAVPMLFPAIGWGSTALIIALLCFGALLPIHFKTKERYVGAAAQEASIGDIFRSLVHNKYLLIFTGASIAGSVTNFAMTLNGYFAIHCLGSASWMTPLALASSVPFLFVALFVPKLLTKVDKFHAYIVTRVITIAIDIVIYLTGYGNPLRLILLISVKNIFAAVWNVTAMMFIADCIEYGQFHFGQRNQGIAFSTKAFTNKMIVALTGALAMFGLAAYGFIEGEGAVQSAHTLSGIWNLYALWPLFGSVISLLIMLFCYKLRDHDVRLMIAVNNGELERESAAKQFRGKF